MQAKKPHIYTHIFNMLCYLLFLLMFLRFPRQPWALKVAGSNPAAPTIFIRRTDKKTSKRRYLDALTHVLSVRLVVPGQPACVDVLVAAARHALPAQIFSVPW
ncbi:MAG: hypothetical protein FJ222_04280 [Lentisphaerae bacterium]|nr:hypothetical protein [Lentisphaerota bacterium]